MPPLHDVLPISSERDTQDAIRMGFDGIIVSNHGGRQLDAAEATISAMQGITGKYGDRIEIMMDSGLRSGPDIARAMACGAKFTFMGRSFLRSEENTSELPSIMRIPYDVF